MTIWIEFLSSWRSISNTNHADPAPRSHKSPLVQFRNRGFDWCCIPRATLYQVIGTLTLPWSYANVLKHIFTFSKMRAWPLDSRPELYYSASWLEWLIHPTKCYTTFNMTQGHTANWSLNDSDRHSFAPKMWSVLQLHYWTPVQSQIHF
jgi:hypothetical protein